MARHKEKELKDGKPQVAARSMSWRNTSKTRKDASKSPDVEEKKKENSRSRSRKQKKTGIFGVQPKSNRQNSGSPGHSYSPRYLEFLH